MSRPAPTANQLRLFYECYAKHGMAYARQWWNAENPTRPLGRSQAYEWVKKAKSRKELEHLTDAMAQQARAYEFLDWIKSMGVQLFEDPDSGLKWESFAAEARKLVQLQLQTTGAMPKGPVELTNNVRLDAESLDSLAGLRAITERAQQQAADNIAALEAAEQQRRKGA